jgi:hypothetical protein
MHLDEQGRVACLFGALPRSPERVHAPLDVLGFGDGGRDADQDRSEQTVDLGRPRQRFAESCGPVQRPQRLPRMAAIMRGEADGVHLGQAR